MATSDDRLMRSGCPRAVAAMLVLAAAQLSALPLAADDRGLDGEALFWGKGQCHQCHRIGDRGDALRGPDLADIGSRAAARAEERGLESSTDYLVESLVDPSAYIVEGYPPGMPAAHHPPINLGGEEIERVVAYLRSLGGEPDAEGAVVIDDADLESPPPPNPYPDGDAERGEEVFRKMRCRACHRVGDQKAVSIGPELTRIGAFRNGAWLAEAILDPNAEIGANWRNVSVELTSGEEINGVLQQRTDEFLQVLYSAEKVRRIPAGEVANVEFTELTRMPANYGELLDDGQLADLIAYLQSLDGD